MNNFVFSEIKLKKEYVYIVFFGLSIITFYFLIFEKIQSYTEIKDRLSKSIQVIEKEKENLKFSEERLKKFENEYEEKRKEKNLNSKKEKKFNFKNLISFEKYLEKIALENKIQIDTVGRIERNSTSTKFFYPVVLKGEETDLINFLKNIENNAKKNNFSNAQWEIVFDKNSLFTGKFFAEVDESIEESLNDEKLYSLTKVMGKNVTKLKKVNLNNECYFLVKFGNKTKILKKGENLEFLDKKYKLIEENENLYLEEIK